MGVEGVQKLNLGCGTTAPVGWINIDRSPGLLISRIPGLRRLLRATGLLPEPQSAVEWPGNIRMLDVRGGLPFPSRTVDAIYSSHMLEHLSLEAALGLLRECRRVLRPGGILRIAVPDLRALTQDYFTSEDPAAADAFVRATYLGSEDEPHGRHRLIRLVTASRHRWMYDGASLHAHLHTAGFTETRACEYQRGELPELHLVEHRPDSIFAEAYA